MDKGLIGWPSLEGIDAGDLDMERLHGTDKGQDRSVSFFATASYAYANRYIWLLVPGWMVRILSEQIIDFLLCGMLV